jgi:hypothetical protein
MKNVEQVKPLILKIYRGMEKDRQRLIRFFVDGLSYQIIREDGQIATIPRKDIDDYIDSGSPQAKSAAKSNIEKALREFKPPEVK